MSTNPGKIDRPTNLLQSPHGLRCRGWGRNQMETPLMASCNLHVVSPSQSDSVTRSVHIVGHQQERTILGAGVSAHTSYVAEVFIHETTEKTIRLCWQARQLCGSIL